MKNTKKILTAFQILFVILVIGGCSLIAEDEAQVSYSQTTASLEIKTLEAGQ